MLLESIATLIFLLPALTALVAGVGGYALPAGAGRDRFAMLLTTGGMVLCGVLSFKLFLLIGMYDTPALNVTLGTWLTTSAYAVEFGLLVDKLTATMLLVVCGVSACVHVYAMGYMADDPHKPRFFAYLSLFTFAMLALVTAPNLLQMFLGWEGVGLASYLLIGFWFEKESANAASMKAFITNRVADAAMLLGLFTLIAVAGSVTYADILPAASTIASKTYMFMGWEIPAAELICLLLFIGAMGKSAQFGLHVWLPDAMEGPTPVSALIHAATMVTAGVFLLCRMSPLFEYAETTLMIVGYVGALTAIFAATVGLTQRDIKRVIAYSTCSQLGYMFFAIGVSAYPAAMFHLTTHAFFKALLFLGAGSVIHGLHHEQDLFNMGGIRKALPITYGLMWIGSLALAGIPPFAGFFSKDLILESAYGAHTDAGYILYTLGTIGALLTAFYSFRVVFMAFHGKFKGHDHHALEHAHESPLVMLVPMLVLAVGAVFGGLVLHGMADVAWWNGSLFVAEHHHALHNAHSTPWLPKYIPLVVAVLGIAASAYVYLKHPRIATLAAEKLDLLYHISFNKWYVDELYDMAIVKPLRRFANTLWKVGDVKIVDGYGPNGVAHAVYRAGTQLATTQTGYVYHYAFAVVGGLAVLIAWLMWGI
ncbi:MAG: NADH-quinone oxidoreductase subunit L [Alphaproteobacteria bacterium]